MSNYLILNSWIGRFGNNMLQLIRAIHYGKLNNYNCLIFPENRYIQNKIIIIDEKKYENKEKIYNNFFYLKKLNCKDPNPYLMKKYFNKFLFSLLKVDIKRNLINDNTNDLYIHIRSGDIFRGNGGHPAYVQPPLKYYKDIIESKNWNKIIVVYEDDFNPCVNALKKENYNNIYFSSNTLENDLTILSNSKNLVIGFGTFGLLLFFLNKNLKSIYLTDYTLKELPQGNWGKDLEFNIINIPNYIKCGEWKNTKEQKKLMIEYN